MSSHVVVVFDHSGSMSEPFRALAPDDRPRARRATRQVKIEEAKAALFAWLDTSAYDQATIIPFNDRPGAPITVQLPGQLQDLVHVLGPFRAKWEYQFRVRA
jgi:hypothetical protein